MDNGTKRTKKIYIFGYKFVFTSFYSDNTWITTVSLGKLSKTYHDFVRDRRLAEEAAFGYFLIDYCQGGIYWQEPDEEEKERLLAEKIL